MPLIFSECLPMVILQCLMEFKQNDINKMLVKECQEVFAGRNLREDISESCQTIFQIFDDLNRVLARDAKTNQKVDVSLNFC